MKPPGPFVKSLFRRAASPRTAYLTLTPALWLIASAASGDERFADPEESRRCDEAWARSLEELSPLLEGASSIRRHAEADGLLSHVGMSLIADEWLALLTQHVRDDQAFREIIGAAQPVVVRQKAWEQAQGRLFAEAARGTLEITATATHRSDAREVIPAAYFAAPRWYCPLDDAISYAPFSMADALEEAIDGDRQRWWHPLLSLDHVEYLIIALGTPHEEAEGSDAMPDEAGCLHWLKDMMRSSPLVPIASKAELAADAKRKFRVSERAFLRLRGTAIDETGAKAWRRAGRPTQKSRQQNRGATN